LQLRSRGSCDLKALVAPGQPLPCEQDFQSSLFRYLRSRGKCSVKLRLHSKWLLL